MKHRGWLLDSYIKGKYAILWLKTVDGEVHKLRDRYTPGFYVEPEKVLKAEETASLFRENPDISSVQVIERYASLRREGLKEVVHVKVNSVEELKRTVNWAKRLREVKGVYNVGLSDIQWYLIALEVAPSDYVEWTEDLGVLGDIAALDDGVSIEPPPFDTVIFQMPNAQSMEEIRVYDGDGHPIQNLAGGAADVLNRFKDMLGELDPDVVVTDDARITTRKISHAAATKGIDLRFGRGGETYGGRILLDLRPFMEVGIAGLAERARFTFAPMGVSADWPAGKTIDARQCFEAKRLGVLVPEMRGGYGNASTVWELFARDRGGMIFSPQAGLHENVGCLDFESMFPNIIVRRNVSYETVGPEGVDAESPGFMGGFTLRFLERRLHFKHLRNGFPKESREWTWCQQRQLALKLILVCIYGYSGCYANRFANVRVFQEINRIARQVMVQSLNIALDRGFEVIYGDSDSLFTKKPQATRNDYEALAEEIAETTGLPINLDRHFKFLVLLSKTTDPQMEAARRYYGKLTDGSLFYRGVALRRHDTPPFIKRLQRDMMKILFDAEDSESVIQNQLPKVQRLVEEACWKISRGKVEPEDLAVSKRLRREPHEYKSLQPHIVAAYLGDFEDEADFIFVNTERRNPFLRIMPKSMLNSGHRHYDRRKYVDLVRRSAYNLLRTIVSDDFRGGRLRESRLDTYF